MLTLEDIAVAIENLYQWKPWGDAVSAGLILGYIVNVLPAVATLLSIIWVSLRIYETCTVQRILYGKPKPPSDYT